jgi:hypothetical protein
MLVGVHAVQFLQPRLHSRILDHGSDSQDFTSSPPTMRVLNHWTASHIQSGIIIESSFA